MRLVVDASNLHSGGSVAVAASVLSQLSSAQTHAELTVFASSEVNANLEGLECNFHGFRWYSKFDRYGIRALWKPLPINVDEYDVLLTLFGPNYSLQRFQRAVSGFAQPWIAYPSKEAYAQLPAMKRPLYWTKYALQVAFFARSDILVVEHDDVRSALLSHRALRNAQIEVVPSSVDSVYFDSRRWLPVSFPQSESQYKVGVIARNYPHKNLRILPEVRQLLLEVHGVEADFYVTLTDDEWAKADRAMRDSLINIGPLSLAQCPTFNSQLDAVVFPSLLECYSSTPPEARALGVPLLASDRPFVRSTVGDYATYFDPLDASDIAAKTASVLARPSGLDSRQREQGPAGVNLTQATDRALALLEVCFKATT